jgi:hypothetical protein
MKSFTTPCYNGLETISLHHSGDDTMPFIMRIGRWEEVGFTVDELRSLSEKITEVISEHTASL